MFKKSTWVAVGIPFLVAGCRKEQAPPVPVQPETDLSIEPILLQAICAASRVSSREGTSAHAGVLVAANGTRHAWLAVEHPKEDAIGGAYFYTGDLAPGAANRVSQICGLGISPKTPPMILTVVVHRPDKTEILAGPKGNTAIEVVTDGDPKERAVRLAEQQANTTFTVGLREYQKNFSNVLGPEGWLEFFEPGYKKTPSSPQE